MVSSPVVEKCKAIFVYLQFDVTAGVNGNQNNKYCSFYLTVVLRVFFVSLFFFFSIFLFVCIIGCVVFFFSDKHSRGKKHKLE